jgi:hypothetical protein
MQRRHPLDVLGRGIYTRLEQRGDHLQTGPKHPVGLTVRCVPTPRVGTAKGSASKGWTATDL